MLYFANEKIFIVEKIRLINIQITLSIFLYVNLLIHFEFIQTAKYQTLKNNPLVSQGGCISTKLAHTRK